MPLNGEMFPAELLAKVAVGVLAGLAYGSAAAFGKRRISAAGMKKAENGGGRAGVLWVLGINGMRMLVNIAAFALVFFLRDALPVSFAAAAAGTAVGLTGEIWLLVLRRSGRGGGRRPDEAGRR